MSARPRRGLQGKDRKCFAIRGTLSGYCCANLGEMFGFRNGWGGFSCRAGGYVNNLVKYGISGWES